MSNTLIKDAPAVRERGVEASPMPSVTQLAENATRSPWIWCTITCVLLAISGGIRTWRDAQFESISKEGDISPFPLSELPKELGTWHVVEGSEGQLEPTIARVAGSADHIMRAYADSKSGEIVRVLALFGRSDTVFAHTPTYCYPSAGYQVVGGGPEVRELPHSGSSTPAKYGTGYYARNSGGLSEYCEVLWTFRHNGVWQPDMKDRWKTFRYQPGMFKVQIHRPSMSTAADDGPSEILLNSIVREIERRLHERNGAPAANSGSELARSK